MSQNRLAQKDIDITSHTGGSVSMEVRERRLVHALMQLGLLVYM